MVLIKKEDKWRVPLKSWCEDIEDGALEQLSNLAQHPAVFHHVAAMADCHQGFGMPIGGVAAFENAVCPNAVGVDIACGMCAVPTDFQVSDLGEKDVLTIVRRIRRRIPTGFDHHATDQEWEGFDRAPDIPVVQRELASAKRQLGTLGGGNHFCEIQAGDDGKVWIMLHSGSRNFGYKIAREYNKKAAKLCQMWHSALPPGKGEDGLAFLPIGCREAAEYIEAMNYAMEFAQANRAAMMAQARTITKSVLGCSFGEEINIHHNFAALENHFGKNVWVHRKGATSAREGQLGIIPGSMGTASYIVRGKGNPDSFMSCSHGAGRAHGRAEFRRTHTVEECDKDMEGIAFGGWSKTRGGDPDISEAPKAYKDIESVIAAQEDLVEPIVRPLPLGVVKG